MVFHYNYAIGIFYSVCVCVGYWGKKRKIVLEGGRRVPTSPRVAA